MASKSCKEFLSVKFPTVFKLFRLAQVLVPLHFSPFSKCASMVLTQSEAVNIIAQMLVQHNVNNQFQNSRSL